ncbi:DUF2339 domain-containing protein [Aerophototrophica crusticola]|uniref:DUF2339 domain-containing protein n=1 Tax=Aerophototrophica crusticola TaxID=1709002 RepID=A0A858R6H3_9PROT|nr:DUF2339 domain-containing protein [Rhodospirillaceae bacterium B3]
MWLGGLTLALGGVFLARYAIEQGLLGPAARMTLAVLLGLALVLGGEWLRRRPLARDLGRIRGDQVPSALVAAGLSIASAAIYASFALHDLLGPATTFVALAAFCLAAQGLALRHGALVALLGLAGGLAFPALIPSDTPSAWTLLAWLLLLTIATLAAARRLGTPWLALPVLAGHAVWTVGLLHLFPRGAADWAALLYVLAVPPLVTWATLGNRAKRRLAAGMAEASGWLATVLAVVLAGCRTGPPPAGPRRSWWVCSSSPSRPPNPDAGACPWRRGC